MQSWDTGASHWKTEVSQRKAGQLHVLEDRKEIRKNSLIVILSPLWFHRAENGNDYNSSEKQLQNEKIIPIPIKQKNYLVAKVFEFYLLTPVTKVLACFVLFFRISVPLTVHAQISQQQP